MRTALFALTAGGVQLAVRLADAVDGSTVIHIPERLRGNISEGYETVYFLRLADVMKTAFTRYDALVCIMATGIVVRMIAPYADSKLYDPAASCQVISAVQMNLRGGFVQLWVPILSLRQRRM